MTTFGNQLPSSSTSSSWSTFASSSSMFREEEEEVCLISLDENLSTLIDLFPSLECEFLHITLIKNENDLAHSIEELLLASPSPSPSSPLSTSPLSSSPLSFSTSVPLRSSSPSPSSSKHLNIGVWSSQNTQREVRSSHLTSALEKLKGVVVGDLHSNFSSSSPFSRTSSYCSSPARVEWVEPSSIDLHGFTVKEARDLMDDLLITSIQRLRKENKRSELEIVVGVGKHSKHGKPKLRGAILSLLKERGHTSWCEPRPGIILVGLNGPFRRT
jgi:DNA-nicking Smr family endonuclease